MVTYKMITKFNGNEVGTCFASSSRSHRRQRMRHAREMNVRSRPCKDTHEHAHKHAHQHAHNPTLLHVCANARAHVQTRLTCGCRRCRGAEASPSDHTSPTTARTLCALSLCSVPSPLQCPAVHPLSTPCNPRVCAQVPAQMWPSPRCADGPRRSSSSFGRTRSCASVRSKTVRATSRRTRGSRHAATPTPPSRPPARPAVAVECT